MVNTSSPAVKAMAPELQEEFCKNFTYGNPLTKEFFSPGYPRWTDLWLVDTLSRDLNTDPWLDDSDKTLISGTTRRASSASGRSPRTTGTFIFIIYMNKIFLNI